MKLKEYRIPIPLTLDEYRLGQQWTEIELLKEVRRTCSTCLTIYENIGEQERAEIIKEKLPSTFHTTITASTPMAHKKYNVKNQMPKFLELLFVKASTDLILDEYSWDSWPYTITIIENAEYHMRLIIQSYYVDNHLAALNRTSHLQSVFSVNDEQMKYLKDYEVINIAERLDSADYRIDEDPTRIQSLKKPHLLPLEVNSKWYEQWPKSCASMCVYKLIELVVANEKTDSQSLLTKATNRLLVNLDFHSDETCHSLSRSHQWSSITKTQKMIYHRFHQKMISSIDVWIDRTVQSIRDEELLLSSLPKTPSLNSSQRLA